MSVIAKNRQNRFLWLQILTHIAAWIPFFVLVWAFLTGNLTVNPIQAAEQHTGDIAIVLLISSLACTPLFTLSRFAPLLNLRRPLGLYAFMYASLHLTLFVGVDYGFDWSAIWTDTNSKRYIWVGVAAFLLLVPIAVTSIRWFVTHMGKNWKRLHKLVYVIGILVVLHFAWVVKGNVSGLKGDATRPALAAVVVGLLLLARVKPVRKRLAAFGQRWFAPPRRNRQVITRKKIETT